MGEIPLMKVLAYGLTLDSEFPLDGLLISDKQADVRITLKDGPCLETESKTIHLSSTEILFIVPLTASFKVSNGNLIEITRHHQDDVRCRIFLLGTVMTLILHQRGNLVLHGSAIDHHGQAILFCGPRGCGKSTLSASYQKDGYPLMSDDVCSIHFDRLGNPWLTPSYPIQKLYKDASMALGLSLDNGTAVPNTPNKFIYPVAHFTSTPLPLKAIIFIEVKPILKVDKLELSLYDVHKYILVNIYRYSMMNEFQKTESFKTISQLTHKVTWINLAHPKSDSSLQEIKQALDALLT
jgi:hypothetical protein